MKNFNYSLGVSRRCLKFQNFAFALCFLFFNSTLTIASDFNKVEKSGNQVKASVTGTKTTKKRSKKKRKGEQTVDGAKVQGNNPDDEDETIFGVGLVGGSNATYGNGLLLHIDPFEYLGSQIGVGYNSTGAKVGAGLSFILPFTDSFGLDMGGSLVHSFGAKDEVSLEAKFTPENGSSTEDVKAIRKFRISPAKYYSFFAGVYYDFTDSFRVDLHGNYNKVISGNDVEFYDQVAYDKPVEANNDENVEQDFGPKARKKLDINGLGLSIGLQYRL